MKRALARCVPQKQLARHRVQTCGGLFFVFFYNITNFIVIRFMKGSMLYEVILFLYYSVYRVMAQR